MIAEVDAYIKKQKSPQKEIVQKLRAVILKTLPAVKEEMKLGVPWYEGKFYIVALKDHVNLGFSVQGLSAQEMGLLEGKGKLMRHLKFFTEAEVDEAKVAQMVKLIAEKGNCNC
jgi:hypothetical protein